jgi:hypothetical protein
LSVIAAEQEPDIILITESWCNASINNALLSLPGYEVQQDLRLDREDTADGRGGGLLVYSKQGLNILSLDSGVDFIQHRKFLVKDLNCYLIYRPPNGSVANMTNLAELISRAGKNSIFIGDFNLPGVDWTTGQSRANEKQVVDAVENKLMTQLVDFPTHIKGNILDLVITNMPERVLEVREEGRLGKSDHSILAIELSVNRGGAETRADMRKDWSKADWNEMENMLKDRDWKQKIREADTEAAWNLFADKINAAVEKCVPERRRRNVNRPPWMTQEILRAIRKKKRLWTKCKGMQNQEEYRKQEKVTRNLIRNAKKKFEKRLAEGGGKNKKPFYAYVKTKTKTRQSVGPLRDKNGQTIKENAAMASLLNNTFGAAFTREAAGDVPDPDEFQRGEKIETVKITVNAVKNKLKGLRREAAAGPDRIGPGILFEMRNVIAPVLTTIYNKSLQSGTVPAAWKDANVSPIFKKGSKTAPENYRPVSLTSVSCKVLESLIKDDMLKHLQKHKLIKKSQHGFLPGRSCSTNLLEFLEKATQAVDNGEAFDAVFLDFAKAFDKVPHARLLKKLKAHGIDGQLHRWIANWLVGRRQRAVLGGEYSSWIDVLSGVPQGSVLGPLLFLIFINDIDEAAAAVDILRKFADDTKLGNTIRSEDDHRQLQEALNNLTAWSEKWGMEFNIKKCKVVHFGRSNRKYEYMMQGEKLAETDVERDIGVEVQQNLKPSKQCAKAATTARLVLSQITRAFHYRDKYTFTKLYKTYVRPHLEFSTPAWSPWTQSDINTLEKVQEKFVNMVSGLAGRNYEQKLKELQLESLASRRQLADLVMVYKIMHGHGDLDPDHWFDKYTGDRLTRAASGPMNVKSRGGRLEIRSGFFSNRVAKSWNEIPEEIKNARTPNHFKNVYSRWKQQRARPNEP